MYIVLELQTSDDGNLAYLATTHKTRPEADSKYHLILSSAAVSQLPVHGAVILDECGLVYGNETYDRREVNEGNSTE